MSILTQQEVEFISVDQWSTGMDEEEMEEYDICHPHWSEDVNYLQKYLQIPIFFDASFEK